MTESIKTPSLMIQGTSSNAGKSILTAAFCRIFLEDGYRIAPFKAQNMSLNSFVTAEGLEIGRAQALQAMAAKIEPDVRMNPILLKPARDKGTQVIINGKPLDNMVWKDYKNYKEKAFSEVKKAYNSLASEYDAIILEGAGSPAEINLKENDISNMHMAAWAKAPVLIAGDIDRGGIYASFVGTMEIFEQWEKDLTVGFLVNRFRGDASLLKTAHDYMLQKTGKPVLGVIPHIYNLGLPEEDSVSWGMKKEKQDNAPLEIVVINLPHISNFTDFDPFEVEEDVKVRIISDTQTIGNPDCIIIPGSKSTAYDLNFLKVTGLSESIIKMAEKGTEVFGICAGFQMLGITVEDPYSIESQKHTSAGLGLLQIRTTMDHSKTLKRLSLPEHISGYEIHHGKTEVFNGKTITDPEGNVIGVSEKNIEGTYLHGIFDNDLYRLKFLNRLREKKNQPQRSSPALYDIEPAIERLAQTVRDSVDMKAVYSLTGLE